MMYWKFIAALVVSIALLPSMAQAANSPELTYPTGTRLEVNKQIRGVTVGEAKFTSESNTINCSSASMAGKLLKNNGTELEAAIESAFKGGSCSGSYAIDTAVSKNGVPWCLRSTPELAEDEVQIRGGSCSTETSQPIRYVTTRTTTTWNECVYERTAAITGTYKTYTEDALLTSTGVAYNKVTGPVLCPLSMSLDTSLTLEKDEGTTNPLYISSGPRVTFPIGVTLATGSKVRAHNVGSITMTTSTGNTVCTGAEITGTLKKNNGTEIEADVETASFSGTGAGGTCTFPSFAATWTFASATNGLPWCLRATSKMAADEFQIRGNSCASASRPIRVIYEFPTSTTDECTYERAAAVTGSVATHPEDAVVTINNSTFLEAEPKSGSCPDETQLDTTLTLEAEEAGTHPMYVS